MKRKNNKIAIAAIFALLVVGLLAGSLAYFSTNYSMDNTFSLNKVGANFVEEFEAPQEGELIYGNTYNKSGQLMNNGNEPVIARAKIRAEWKNADDQIVDNKIATGPDKFAATLNFGSSADFTTTDYTSFHKRATGNGKWVYHADDYFYYQNIVASKTNSDKLLESVTFSTDIGESTISKKYYIKSMYDAWQADTTKPEPTSYATQSDATTAANGGSITCIEVRTMTYPGFEKAVLTVKIEGEIIEYNAEAYEKVSTQPTNPWVVDFSFFTE